jgi:hypothetical protein
MSYFYYLIDQQCSQAMYVEVVNSSTTYQPIEVSTVTPMVSDKKSRIMRLSREQALELARLLKKAAKEVPIPSEHLEYPGKIVE